MGNVMVASLFVVSFLGMMISLMTVSPSMAAPVCHTIQNQTVCILTIKRSAKNYWEYSAAVSIDGKRGRKESYNCRARYKTLRDGSIEYFENPSIGTLVCKTYKPRRVGVPATLSMD